MQELNGNRINLREWNFDDVFDLFEYASLKNVGPKAGWSPHKNIDESKSIIKRFKKDNDVYAIELKSNAKVIGSIGFHNRIISKELEKYKQREIAIVLNPKYWGNEYSEEAIHLLINYGFNILKLDFVWMCHHADNMNSKKMIDKCNLEYVFQHNVILERLNHKKVTMLYYCLKNPCKT